MYQFILSVNPYIYGANTRGNRCTVDELGGNEEVHNGAIHIVQSGAGRSSEYLVFYGRLEKAVDEAYDLLFALLARAVSVLTECRGQLPPNFRRKKADQIDAATLDSLRSLAQAIFADAVSPRGE